MDALARILNSDSALATAIEVALFDAFHDKQSGHCGQAYKSKYMSLLFNLKDPKNEGLRGKVLSGTVSPVELVHMTSAEMANDDLSQMIKTVREQSVSRAVLEDINGAVFVKKTHKGEESFSRSSSTELPIIQPVQPTTPLPSIIINDTPQPIRSARNWNGLVLLQDIANFEVEAVSIGRSDLTRAIQLQLPASLHIQGRIPPVKVSTYLESIAGLETRRTFVLRLDSLGVDDCSKADPNRLIDYLMYSDRFAVITVNPLRNNQLRDLYMIPCSMLGKIKETLVKLDLIDQSCIAEIEGNTSYSKSFLLLLVVSIH